MELILLGVMNLVLPKNIGIFIIKNIILIIALKLKMKTQILSSVTLKNIYLHKLKINNNIINKKIKFI